MKPHDIQRAGRRSIRLKGHDYRSAGIYFVTICARDRRCLFGEVRNREMHLNDLGKIVRHEWLQTAIVRPNVEIYEDELIVMPNHLHVLIRIVSDDLEETSEPPTGDGRPKGPSSGSVGAIVGQVKARATKRIRQVRPDLPVPLWHRNYYEQVVRSERALHSIRRYIEANPAKWHEDRLNPTIGPRRRPPAKNA